MNKYLSFILRAVISIILLQSLWFKFQGLPESVYIFTKVGMEPVGRIAVGIVELIAGVLILIPRTIWAGAALAFGATAGAVFMHLTLLGIEVQGDGGALFAMAVFVSTTSALILWFQRKDIPVVGARFS
ncbi:MAG: DoxX family membrane protein [Bacteroidota bacterium]